MAETITDREMLAWVQAAREAMPGASEAEMAQKLDQLAEELQRRIERPKEDPTTPLCIWEDMLVYLGPNGGKTNPDLKGWLDAYQSRHGVAQMRDLALDLAPIIDRQWDLWEPTHQSGDPFDWEYVPRYLRYLLEVAGGLDDRDPVGHTVAGALACFNDTDAATLLDRVNLSDLHIEQAGEFPDGHDRFCARLSEVSEDLRPISVFRTVYGTDAEGKTMAALDFADESDKGEEHQAEVDALVLASMERLKEYLSSARLQGLKVFPTNQWNESFQLISEVSGREIGVFSSKEKAEAKARELMENAYDYFRDHYLHFGAYPGNMIFVDFYDSPEEMGQKECLEEDDLCLNIRECLGMLTEDQKSGIEKERSKINASLALPDEGSVTPEDGPSPGR